MNESFKLKNIIAFAVLFLLLLNLHAEEGDSLKQAGKVYSLNYKIEAPLIAVGIGTALWGFYIIDQKTPLDSMTIIGLDANDINRFDRSATWQDAEFAPTARKISDLTLGVSQMLPFLLMFDKKIRQDWGDIILLFFETQAIVGNLHSWGMVMHVDRIRPLVYNPDVHWDEKTGKRTKNAFYSGHTSMSASASFFAAQVYCDYHPELGNRKYLVYSLALVPPALTGFFRYKGLKHFPTDVLTGILFGAGTGILVPHLHKITGPNLSVMPLAGQVNGLAMSYRF
jgi:membrane-associated phospholipid phosphatase